MKKNMSSFYDLVTEYAHDVAQPFKERKKQHITEFLHSHGIGQNDSATSPKFATLNVRIIRSAIGKPDIRWYQTKKKSATRRSAASGSNNDYFKINKFKTHVSVFANRNPWELEYGVQCEEEFKKIRMAVNEYEQIRRRLVKLNMYIAKELPALLPPRSELEVSVCNQD